ncbi:Gfo/Idh/MocA family oxidoreductase [Pseudarthrobacter sp. J64]|uniref:Gfo/Idh/MocA family protein n=1 Tax=Pseudarthrobacter sp. J64 TaxID=3116485 RepID=UPI002E81D488|nr:Gfo/Idh/MocA family oxidoreductase [Pseudarthrobacter sp. J64]MEE2569919.1 Gfo/Idh/MocA family oxidoreductase [Pseudarthrobacter sp. J64]
MSSPADRPLRWGVVATGRIAHRVTSDLAQLEDAELYAVSSRTEAAAQAFAGRFGFAASYADDAGATGYQQLFDDPLVDVVYIATPHAQHAEVARAALKSGKHVVCEKPLTINAREAEELADLARDGGLFLMEAMWTRFLPATRRAMELIRSGAIGDVRWVQADLGFAAAYDPTDRLWDPAAGGGALLDLTVYPLTWAVAALGFPAGMAAACQLNGDGVDVQNTLTLHYPDGAVAQLVSTLQADGPGTATISGSKGWLRVGAPLYNPRQLEICGQDGVPRVEAFEEEDEGAEGFIHELREAARCIRAGLQESPLMPWADSVAMMKLLDEARRQLGLRYVNDAG